MTADVQWRITRSLHGHRVQVGMDTAAATGCFTVVLLLLALTGWMLTNDSESVPERIFMLFPLLLWMAVPAGFGMVAARRVWEVARRREDRIGLTGTDLWWHRWRPARPGSEPIHVDRHQVAQIRLGPGDRTVVVSTTDGTERIVTALGSVADRVALTRSIGAALGPGVARDHRVTPPDLPRGWRVSEDGAETLVWRRTTAWRTWGLGVFTYFFLPVALGLPQRAPSWLRWPLDIAMFALICGLIALIRAEATRSCHAWLVGTGVLETIYVRTRTGRREAGRSRVTALRLTHGGRRLAAAHGSPTHFVTVTRGRRRRVRELAAWLAERADLPRD